MAGFSSLRQRGVFWVLASLIAGVLITWVWMSSQAAWQAHLTRAFLKGLELHATLKSGAAPPDGLVIKAIAGAPPTDGRGYVTRVSILSPDADAVTGERLVVHIHSSDLQYSVAEIASDGGASAASRLANITRVLASYCSAPLLYAHPGEGPWFRIDGREVWGCAAAPPDLRLAAGLGLVLALIVLLSQVKEISLRFQRFAQALRKERRMGSTENYSTEGPAELREIVDAVNANLAAQRETLANRTEVLSAVSHDLGTPATRLRLRTALIEDEELRCKLEADIDRMTSMIDSVLTFTRSEMNAEAPRQLSLTSLVAAVVDDYTDLDRPVTLLAGEQSEIGASPGLFSAHSGRTKVTYEDQRRVLVQARPIALRRAVTNLIDNALKYGRRAAVSVEANSERARILVSDEGGGIDEAQVEELMAPFKRGANAQNIEGVGLGLSIVSTIAEQHGGTLAYERNGKGLTAILTLSRR